MKALFYFALICSFHLSCIVSCLFLVIFTFKQSLFAEVPPSGIMDNSDSKEELNEHSLLSYYQRGASSGNGRKVARKVIQQLKQQELKYTALYTDYAGHEKELTKELAETTLLPWSEDDVSTFPILVVLGGDGTHIMSLIHYFHMIQLFL